MLTATWDAVFTLTAAAPTWTPPPLPTATDFPLEVVQAEMWGIPSFRAADGAFVLGSPDAPTTLVVFSDWACPHCQNLAPVIEEFIASDVASGAVNLEHRTMITAGGNATRAAARLAECVEQQRPGAFWSAYPALFGIAQLEPNVYNNPATLADALGTTIGLDDKALLACSETATQIVTDEHYAAEIGANYTPFVAVRDADGTLTVINDRTLEGIHAAIYGELPPVMLTPTFTPEETVQTGATAQASRATHLAGMVATQTAIHAVTATATPAP